MELKEVYFTLSEAAKHARVTRQTMSRWVADGGIPGEKVGRTVLIRKLKLEEYLLEQSAKSAVTGLWRNITDALGDLIRHEYGGGDEDTVTLLGENRKSRTYIFSLSRGEGVPDRVSATIGEAETFTQLTRDSVVVGVRVPIERLRRTVWPNSQLEQPTTPK